MVDGPIHIHIGRIVVVLQQQVDIALTWQLLLVLNRRTLKKKRGESEASGHEPAFRSEKDWFDVQRRVCQWANWCMSDCQLAQSIF